MLCLNISDIAIITVKGADYRCIIRDILHLMIVVIYKMHTKKINIKNQAHYHYENLFKPKKLETKNIFIDKKSYKDLVIYFTGYHFDKSITMLNVYCDELIGKIVDFQGKKYLMVHGCTLDKVLDKNKRIGIEKLDDTTF